MLIKLSKVAATQTDCRKCAPYDYVYRRCIAKDRLYINENVANAVQMIICVTDAHTFPNTVRQYALRINKQMQTRTQTRVRLP